MLAMLLYHAGEPVRVDSIVEELWPGGTVPGHRASLYALASRNRAVLDRVGLRDALVRINPTGAYRLEVDPELVDFHRFRRIVGEAREAARERRYDDCAALLDGAIALWRDEPLADLHGIRSEHLRRHMNGVLLDAHKLLAHVQLRTGQHQAVLARLEPFIHQYEIDETLAQTWIAALGAAGRDDDARTFFLAVRRRFRKEMHVDPAVELPVARKGIRISRSGSPTGVRAAAGPVPEQLPNDINDFTGRAEVLTELDTLMGPGRAGPNTVVISGMPGSGKTTLAVHWAHRQRLRFPDGQLYLNAHAYGPVRPVEPEDALGRFLHALDVPADRIPLGLDQRRGRVKQLLAGRPGVVPFGNNQDCRPAGAPPAGAEDRV